ncbi:hypothetical protein GQ53DRAFT_812435 [Thozetella sp. PMI_491]|nr:hypothetical protein GQ53DRAFT_812435 [Thozetella sp. PMI_491]
MTISAAHVSSFRSDHNGHPYAFVKFMCVCSATMKEAATKHVTRLIRDSSAAIPEHDEYDGAQPNAGVPQRSNTTSNFDLTLTAAQNSQSPQSANEQAVTLRDHWFLAYHSWNIDHLAPQDIPNDFHEETLKAYVAILETWLKEWVTKDHSALIHRYLYRIHMPRCMQDAYTALATYLGRTPATAATVCRIIEDRLDRLIQDSIFEDTLSFVALTPLDHVARVQALFIYHIICLFDGDIRLRGCAERQFPTLLSWSDQMWQRITEQSIAGDPFTLVAPTTGSDDSLSTWRVWIFLESARRTWLTCAILHGVYMTIRDGYSACPGGLYSQQWETKATHARDTRFIQSLRIGELFTKAEPDSVDEFGHAVMMVSFGLHKLESWKAEGRSEAYY